MSNYQRLRINRAPAGVYEGNASATPLQPHHFTSSNQDHVKKSQFNVARAKDIFPSDQTSIEAIHTLARFDPTGFAPLFRQSGVIKLSESLCRKLIPTT
jgi:hypothetical protein